MLTIPLMLIALLLGWLLDLLLGDPARLPHPVVLFGRMIALGERHLNHGAWRRLKGGLLAVGLVLLVFAAVWGLRHWLGSVHVALCLGLDVLIIFFCLAGTTLIREVRAVFQALDRSLDEGRRQVARIVGRDTAQLSAQEVRTAALETLAENLSDGVIAPLFWLALLGTPGMLAYKMVNTLDSMVGYRTDRYRRFGTVAARMDDVANYLPARLTALLMIAVPVRSRGAEECRDAGDRPASEARPRGFCGRLRFVLKYGPQHASPNSGWPEAALASILDCRFGGPHDYFGQRFDKPYIGHHDRPLTTADMKTATTVNRVAESLMVLLTAAALSVMPNA